MMLPLLLAAGVGMVSCRRSADADALPDEIVAQVGDSALMMREVLVRIPYGMTPADSAMLFNSIVDGWIDRLLLEDLGRDNIDEMAEIERMVNDYRKRLIVATYRRKLREAHRQSVPDDTIRRYYAGHPDEFILERPVVKGLYVKLPADASRLGEVRRWLMTATPEAIDNLERYGLNDAIEYSFFEDNWTDWNLIARQIPYRFGDADQFVGTRRDFETTYGGMTYLLHISDHMPSGNIMPYEVAYPLISERLEGNWNEANERALMQRIHAKARREGKLRDFRQTPQPADKKI